MKLFFLPLVGTVLWIFLTIPLLAQDDGLDINDFDDKPAKKEPQEQPKQPVVPDKPDSKNSPTDDTQTPAVDAKTTEPTVSKPTTTAPAPEVKHENQPAVKRPAGDQQEKASETKPQDVMEQEAKEAESADSGGLRFNEDRTTRYLTLGGSLGVLFIYRDDLFADAVMGSTSTGTDQKFFDPRITLNLTIQMQNNIRGILELSNEVREEKLHKTSLGTHYIASRSSETEFKLAVEKAYVEIGHFLTSGLTFKGGVIPFKRALRADGQAFFIDMGEAESPFNTRPDTHNAGVLMTYQPIQQIQFYADAFYFITAPSGFKRKDETVVGLNLDLDMSKEARGDDESRIPLPRFFNLSLTAIQGDNRAPVWTFGAGFSYFMSSDPQSYSIELYSELLFQFGKYKALDVVSAKEQHQLALGSYGGFRWTLRQSKFKPFLDASAWYVSGDDDDPQSNTNHDLVTYENIDSTLILEDNDYGLDVDSNYWGVKLQGGFSLAPLFGEEMRLIVLYAHLETVDAPPHRTHRLGEEIDVRLTWEYSSDLSFNFASGVLWNSRHFQEVFDEVGAKGQQHAFVMRLETILNF